MNGSSSHKTRTLWLCGVLHAFTHIYHVALFPLYLPLQKDLKLATIEAATLLVTAMMIAYFAPSYALGALADTMSRKKLLALGLTINGAAFIGLSFAPNYLMALVCVSLAGFGGSFFHPAATAMVARLFPVGTGRALGLLGIGASVGFFFGPLYAGWRAQTAGWRAPVLELGLLGLLAAGVFAWLAEEETTPSAATQAGPCRRPVFPTPGRWIIFAAASLLFGLRDFAGSSMGSLGSLFMQNAHGFNLKETGIALSGMFLAAIISNPLFGHLSDRGRIRWTTLVLIIATALVAIFPRMPPEWLVPTYALYGFFFMASYPMVEAALMDSVPDSVRGRVFGFFITIGGLVGNLSHWMAGGWVKRLGAAAHTPTAYYPLYLTLSGLLFLALFGLPCLHAIRRREHPPDRATDQQVARPSPLRASQGQSTVSDNTQGADR